MQRGLEAPDENAGSDDDSDGEGGKVRKPKFHVDFYPGTIVSVNERSRTYGVNFDDGGVDDEVERRHIHSLQTLKKIPKAIRLRVGDRVSAGWKEEPEVPVPPAAEPGKFA